MEHWLVHRQGYWKMMKKLITKLNNKKGMTLIEVVVSFAILAIIAVVIIMGFRTMGAVSQEGNKIDNIDEQLEQQVAASGDPESETGADLTTSDSSITIKGKVKQYTVNEDGKELTFRVFEADEAQE